MSKASPGWQWGSKMATKANLIIDQGTDFSTTLTVADANDAIINLTGYTARGQIRKHYTSSTSVDFIIEPANLGDNGKITIKLSSANTASMEPGRYVYDVEMRSSSNTVSRALEGVLTITPEVTR